MLDNIIKNRINEIQLNNTDIGNFITYFNKNNDSYLVFQNTTFVLNNKLEIIHSSMNKGIN